MITVGMMFSNGSQCIDQNICDYPCSRVLQVDKFFRPIYADDFYHYLDWFLSTAPGNNCPAAGSPFTPDIV